MITISFPRKGATIYGAYTSEFIDGIGPYMCCKPEDMVSVTIKADTLIQGKVFDSYGNKYVSHEKHEGHINLSYLDKSFKYYTYHYSGYDKIAITGKFNSIYYYKPAIRSGFPSSYDYIYDEWSPGRMERHRKYLDEVNIFTWSAVADFQNNTCTFSGKQDIYYSGELYTLDSSFTTVVQLFPIGIAESDYDDFMSLISLPPLTIPPDISPVDNPKLYQDIMDVALVPNINNVENTLSLRDIKQQIPPILDLIKKHNIKSLADMYLWYKYVYKTTCMDFSEWFSFLSRCYSATKRDTNKVTVGATCDRDGWFCKSTYHVYYSTYTSSIIRMLGLNPSSANLWDTIPFSFVVDWFINIGDTLSYLDNYDFVTRLPITNIYVGNKFTKPVLITDSKINVSHHITSSFYERYHLSALPVSEPIISIKNPSRHIVDGAALIFANKR